jgi:hypothetical protein
MLSQAEIEDVWKRQIAAEIRSLYFADLASRFTTQKRWITALSFFLSSGAAVSLLAKFPAWVPVALSLLTAAMMAYSVAFSLDSRMRSMASLHSEESALANDYERLWNSTYIDEAAAQLRTLIQRDRELSEKATTEAPNDERRMERWQDYIFRQHGLPTA